MVDWTAWNNRYDDPEDWLTGRLEIVERQLLDVLRDRAAGPVRLISVCAGQGRDVIGALTGYPRRAEVSALLVELDRATVETGRRLARAADLPGVRFAVGDASLTDAYRDTVPADVILVCGVFGNITDEDIHRTIGLLPQLCAAGASVIWTRGQRDPTADLVPAIRGWWSEAGFVQEQLARSPAGFSVGRHRYAGPAQPLVEGQSMFTFRGFDQLADAATGSPTTAAPPRPGRS